jgi:replication-associated recombination protein RarA
MKTTLLPPFENLFFVPRIANELNRYIKNPDKIPNVLCLYGNPGLGKTAFSKLFAETFAEHSQYIPMNEHTKDIETKAFKKKLLFNTTTLRVSPENHPFESVVILDEFHNIAPKQQDVFKVMFDNLRQQEIVIICCNTTSKKSIKKTLSPAIYSRVHLVRFDLEEREREHHAKDLAEIFTNLKLLEIVSWLPDMRRIVRESKMRSA